MTLFVGLLLISTLLCTLVTGFVFTYAVIVMPGLSKLGDREFIRAFQVTDEIIQNNQPIFMVVWVGSIISVMGTIVTAFIAHDGGANWLVIATGVVYLLGVQGVTISIHLPLNRQIQCVKTDEMDPKSLHEQRTPFEARWTHFNKIRTAIACVVSASFMFALSMN